MLRIFSSKIIAGLIVLGIISAIILSGPAEAFVLSLSIPKNIVEIGETITITANVKTSEKTDRPSDVDYLILKLEGPENIECRFLPNATIVSGCKGIKINKLSDENKGYCKSYGYGEGCNSRYEIKIGTMNYETGIYKTFITINAKGKNLTIPGEDITINLKGKVCSIRASNGELKINSLDFSKNKISFYIPLKNAIKGEGYLTGQRNRERFIYRFKIEQVILNNRDIIKVRVSGKYRIGTGENIAENGVLVFDRIQNITSLTGDNINLNGMKINFREGC